MKGAKNYVDLGTIFDEIFEVAQNFSSEFHRNLDPFNNNSPHCERERGEGMRNPFASFNSSFTENTDYYPNYSYPPMNVYMAPDRSMIFEFALAGFDEKDINLSFQGDYMVFSARIKEESVMHEDNVRYFKRRLKLKDIEKQKYFVPLDKYAQEKVKAVYKNGILKIHIPPKDEPEQSEGIKIEIIKEENS